MRVFAAVFMAGILATVAISGQGSGTAANPISQSIGNAWNNAKLNIRESAEQMSEEKFAFKPVDSVKSFGAILAHVAGASYDYCSMAKGVASPFSEDHFEQNAKTKADIVKAVNEAIAYCDPIYKDLTDQTAAAMVSSPGSSRQRPRAALLIGNVTHMNEHYGNLVTYFRLNGMVPPSTAREQKQ